MNDLPAPTTRADMLLGQIERLVRSDLDPSRIQALLDVYNAERNRMQLEAFNRAQSLLQSEIYEVAATGTNPTFRSAYPKLHDLLKESRPHYTRLGFSIRFGTALQKTAAPAPREGWIRVVIIVSHTEGHWEEHYLDGPPDIVQSGGRGRSPVQSVGSTVTYLRRYLLMMVLNLVPGGDPTDDDGEGGGDAVITPEQVAEIEGLIKDCGLGIPEVESLLKAVEASNIAAIPARLFPRLMNTLIARKKRQQEYDKD